MTVTYAIDHVPTTTESVNVEVAPKSEMSHIRTYADNSSGELVSEYRLASGDELYPATVVYRYGVSARKDGAKRRISWSLYTWARKTDSAVSEDKVEQVVATVQLILPATLTVEVADLDDMLGNLFSYGYPSVTTGARATTWLQALLYGKTQLV